MSNKCRECGGETLCSGGNWICQNEECPGSVEIKQTYIDAAMKSLFDTSNKRILETYLRMSYKTLVYRVTNVLKIYYADGYRDGQFDAKKRESGDLLNLLSNPQSEENENV